MSGIDAVRYFNLFCAGAAFGAHEWNWFAVFVVLFITGIILTRWEPVKS